MILTNNKALLEVLRQKWPDIPARNWEIRPLAGLTQGSHYITDGVHQMVGRRQMWHGGALGISRQRENRILRRLSFVGIAPKVIAMHSDWLLLEWLSGTKVTAEAFGLPSFQQSLAQIVANLHHHSPLGYSLQLKQQIASQWQQIDNQRLSPDWLRLHKLFMTAKMPVPLKIAPAHMDIHPDNLLMTSEGLKLIDWEYATDVDIGFSLATLFKGNQWDEIQQKTFLNYYCTYASGYIDIVLLEQKIKQWEPWVRYMMLMWYEVRWQQTKELQFSALAHSLRLSFNLAF
ncbi:phosphotransferase [Xenorhabdus budapestensis]|uniref:Thiamine kinase n=1 Tax=Xenorhabdus budapestensis TaxID=290110 RepID=A0ABX7VKU9_XENBU|nr:phosphotransferase [Xenorhabdus budapestensis]QTL41308.1 phosphotransferase [Xenorhabdus budapestensis]